MVSLGGFGLLLMLLLTGRLVTKSQYEEVKADRDSYKKTAELLLNDKQADLTRDTTMIHLLEEIKELAKEGKT